MKRFAIIQLFLGVYAWAADSNIVVQAPYDPNYIESSGVLNPTIAVVQNQSAVSSSQFNLDWYLVSKPSVGCSMASVNLSTDQRYYLTSSWVGSMLAGTSAAISSESILFSEITAGGASLIGGEYCLYVDAVTNFTETSSADNRAVFAMPIYFNGELLSIDTAGVLDHETSILVYPSISRDQITIRASLVGHAKLQVIDLSGKVVHQSDFNKTNQLSLHDQMVTVIDVSAFADGQYIIIASDGVKALSGRFIVAQ
jgi:hypothetical protein